MDFKNGSRACLICLLMGQKGRTSPVSGFAGAFLDPDNAHFPAHGAPSLCQILDTNSISRFFAQGKLHQNQIVIMTVAVFHSPRLPAVLDKAKRIIHRFRALVLPGDG